MLPSPPRQSHDHHNYSNYNYNCSNYNYNCSNYNYNCSNFSNINFRNYKYSTCSAV